MIDVAKFTDPEKGVFENENHFLTCLECIEADMLKGIMINARDLVSVVFYNTLNSPSPHPKFAEDDGIMTVVPSNCAVFIPLKPLSKDLIQYFKSFKDSEDFFDFAQTYGSSDESCFHESLWLCSRMMSQSNYKLGTSKIILFTNNELPHADSTHEQTQAISRAKDLLDNNIYVELVPLLDVFDMKPFFDEFLCAVEGVEKGEFPIFCPMDQRYRLMNRVYRANYKNSCLRHLNFELADGVAMACDIFSFTRTAKKPNAVKMFRSNNEMVIAKRCHVVEVRDPEDEDQTVHRKVLPGELFKSQTILNKEIVFSPAEVINMKSLQNPGLRLLGFKPLDQLRPRWMIKHCLFLYPNEKKTIGSTTLFRALWEKCLEKEKFALCTLTMRRVATPKYNAIFLSICFDTVTEYIRLF